VPPDASRRHWPRPCACHQFRTTRLLTFDERHFRAIKPLSGESFTILPADA